MINYQQHARILELHGIGCSDLRIAREVGVSRDSVRKYRVLPLPAHKDDWLRNFSPIQQCHYSYILGLYLGDGCIDKTARTYRIRFFFHDTDDRDTVERLKISLRVIFPDNAISVTRKTYARCVVVSLYSNKIPNLFPQHGIGKKNSRDVSLVDSQTFVTDYYAIELLCGLLDSDGSKYQRVQGGKSLSAYQFTNTSTHIINLYKHLLDKYEISYSSTKKPTVGNRKTCYNVLTQASNCVSSIDRLYNLGYDRLSGSVAELV